jgi:hypothetical protein
MSGWIKIEKALETDPRTTRMAKALAKRFKVMVINEESEFCNACELPAVTLVCGCLTRLWIFADSHIRQDNSLDMSATEIDEWLGIPGFCELMPAEWLVQLEDGRVELPDFLAHNGVEAKKKALSAKRVENFRTRKEATPCNAPALPDQTRPDLDQTKQEVRAFAPRGTDAERHANFEKLKAVYPPCVAANWLLGEKFSSALVSNGESTWPALIENARLYQAYCKATGCPVTNPKNYYVDKSKWSETWPIPTKPGTPAKSNDDAAWAEARHTAKEIGFRDSWPGESVSSYARQVKEFRDRPPEVPLSERRGLAGIKRIGGT